MSDTADMWGEMLGLGGLLNMLKDPQFFAQCRQLFDGLIELDKRTVRIERKLDLIAERIGVDLAEFGSGPAVPAADGTDGGPARRGAASRAADDGAGRAAQARRIAGV
jgi:hypothetical protein